MDTPRTGVVELCHRTLVDFAGGNRLSPKAVDRKRTSELSNRPTPFGSDQQPETFFYLAVDVARLRTRRKRGITEWIELPIP